MMKKMKKNNTMKNIMIKIKKIMMKMKKMMIMKKMIKLTTICIILMMINKVK
jgi:hypothetical protein